MLRMGLSWAGVTLLLASCLALQPAPQPSASLPGTPLPSVSLSPSPTPKPDPNYPRNEYGAILAINLHYPVEIVAGNGKQGSVNGPALQAEFEKPQGLCTDNRNGDIYITDGNQLRKLTPDGQVLTVAGSSEVGLKDGSLQDARFSNLWKCEVDAEGIIYLVDQTRKLIRKISPQGQVTTLPNTYETARKLTTQVNDLALSPDNQLYFTDRFNIGRIQQDKLILLNPNQLSAGSIDDGEFRYADFQNVHFGSWLKIAFTPDGSLYIADHDRKYLFKKSPDNQVRIVFYDAPDLEPQSFEGVFANNLIYDPFSQQLIAADSVGVVQLDLQARPQYLMKEAANSPNLSLGDALHPDVSIGKDHHVYFIDAGTRQIKRILMPSP